MDAPSSPLTPSQTSGPYVSLGMMTDICNSPTIESIQIGGTLTDGDSQPVADALIELWHADPTGSYRSGVFRRAVTGADGVWRAEVGQPGMVRGIGTMQAPHVSVLVISGGLLRHLHTRMYFPNQEAANDVDGVLTAVADPSRRSTLIGIAEPWGIRFDIRLQGVGETVFFDV